MQTTVICEEKLTFGNLPMEESTLKHLGGGSIQEQVSHSLQKGSPKQKAFLHVRLQNNAVRGVVTLQFSYDRILRGYGIIPRLLIMPPLGLRPQAA